MTRIIPEPLTRGVQGQLRLGSCNALITLILGLTFLGLKILLFLLLIAVCVLSLLLVLLSWITLLVELLLILIALLLLLLRTAWVLWISFS